MALSLGSSLIDFSLPATDGNTYTPHATLDGQKALAVVFTCNHCPYVLAWEDRMIAAANDYAAQGVRFLLIGANDAEKYPADSFEKMVEHAAEKSFPFPYLHDESQATARAYGAERTPEIFLFDANGVLAYHGAPDDNYEDPDSVTQTYLRDAIEAVLAGNTPAVASTPPKGCSIKWK